MTRSEHTDIRVNYEKGSITDIFNRTFQTNPDYDFYMMLNDDILFKTKDWDIKLAQKGKISYGDDLFQSQNLPTFPMIDGDIVRALGWLQLPTLNKYAGDIVWRFIGENLKILNYVPEVKIEHKWEGCSDPDMNTKDMQSFANWLPWSFKDLEKVRRAING